VPRLPTLFIAEDYFAAADHLIVEPQAIFVRAGLGAYRGWTAQQAHTGWGLENVGRERAAIDVEFHAQVARIGEPTDLIAGVENHDLRDQSNQHRTFGHACSGSCRLRASAQ
jgi:hypothetical protein